MGKIHSEEEHPISRPLMKIYQPVVELSLDHKWVPITVALLLMAVTIPVYNKLGSEFMPPLDEGTLLYMPTTTPGISVGEASMLLHEQDRILQQLSAGAVGLRQGGTRGERHRSRAALDDGNRRRAEASRAMA